MENGHFDPFEINRIRKNPWLTQNPVRHFTYSIVQRIRSRVVSGTRCRSHSGNSKKRLITFAADGTVSAGSDQVRQMKSTISICTTSKRYLISLPKSKTRITGRYCFFLVFFFKILRGLNKTEVLE